MHGLVDGLASCVISQVTVEIFIEESTYSLLAPSPSCVSLLLPIICNCYILIESFLLLDSHYIIKYSMQINYGGPNVERVLSASGKFFLYVFLLLFDTACERKNWKLKLFTIVVQRHQMGLCR